MKRISHGFLICKHRLIQERLTANFILMPFIVFFLSYNLCLSATVFDCFFSHSEMLGGSLFNQFVIIASLCHSHHHFIYFQDQRSLLTLYLRIYYNMIKEGGGGWSVIIQEIKNPKAYISVPGKESKL